MYSTFDEKLTFASLTMFDIQYLRSEWYDKGAILPSGMEILGVSVNWKWDRLVTYWLALVLYQEMFQTIKHLLTNQANQGSFKTES